ncbi:cytochrome c oxidase assembly protein [Streptomyces rhizosphaericus]|uniref:Cytochrome c oxidase assembly protein n=1 Tax=Streptomyces rhizosphaericus TaxID=114699 RepID=A0A6G4AN20_9ACTN|nr:cytochrome c oxidase assembly protein [Streptomyces rhizosphaericus]NEW74011.1 cytochrome c oxidase assembly protein [Streptomyces rhizosphaericus]
MGSDAAHPGHGHGGGGGPLEVWLPALALVGCAAGYALTVRRARRRHPARGWPLARTLSFAAGLVLVAMALLPPLAPFAHEDFRGHMAQHLLLGMYAPLALTLAAPVTLLLRALPPDRGRRLTAVFRSRPARLLGHPVTALLLTTGGLVPLYFTPVYDATMGHPGWHWLTHAHFLLSGWLFAYVIAGPDPAPARPGVPARLVVLGVAIAAHAVIAQLMYGGFWVEVRAPIAEVRGGAEIMYYGGDLAELLLAAALVTTWRPVRTPRRTHGSRVRTLRRSEERRPEEGIRAPRALPKSG